MSSNLAFNELRSAVEKLESEIASGPIVPTVTPHEIRGHLASRYDFANPLYPPFEICESAVFLQERGAWKDESRKLGGLAHKQILDDEKLQVPESLMHLLQIGIGLRNIIADDP